MKLDIVVSALSSCVVVLLYLASTDAACTVSERRFYWQCKPQYRVETSGKCTTEIRFNRACTAMLQDMSNDCKPCCEQYGISSRRKGVRPTPCEEETLFAPTTCPPDESKNACKVPFAGESKNLLVMLCDGADPTPLCQSYLAKSTQYGCTSCCTNDAFYGGGGDVPHCSEVFPGMPSTGK